MSINIIKTDLKFGSLQYSNNPNKLVLHHLEATGWTVEDVHRCHREDKGWSGIGYHIYVRKDGSIYQGRDFNAIGAHCPGQNSNSIGICAEGRYDSETMPYEQKQAIISLGIYLKGLYNIQGVYGHGELYSTDCPGANYPLNEIRNAIMSGTELSAYSSDCIKSVQHDLQRVSCLKSGEEYATGKLDTNTINAINQFGYIIDKNFNGKISDDLINCLNIITKKPTVGTGWNCSPIAIKFIQWYLGINPKNGICDNNTIQKAKEWQIKTGIWSASGADGIIRDKDWSKILK